MATIAQSTHLPEVEAFLSRGPLKAIIGGQEMESANGDTFETHDPGSGEKLAEVFNMQADDVNRAVDVATETFKNSGWAILPQNERSVHLHRLADAVEKRKAVFAQLESLDCGKVLAQAGDDIQNFCDTMRYFADLALHVQRRTALPAKGHEAFTVRLPWGPCGFIVPWNFPFLLTGWGIGPAMAAGNTCVVKPAEDSPLTTLYVAHIAREAGIPAGVINVIPGLGEVAGCALADNTRLKRMSFTGSPEIGREIASKCGRNLIPIKCELGGKGAAVVCNDVDVPATAQKLVEAITFHAGQVCCDATRWLIQRDIYDTFVAECVDRMKKVHVGYQLDDTTQMGPVVNEKQEKRVLGYLERGAKEGAEIVLEGGKAEVPGRDGHYVKPALLAGSLDNVAAREEIFGPVAYLAPYDTDEQAIGLTNNTEYGLGNSVWSSNLQRAHGLAEQLVSGNSWINGHNLVVHGVPYAGIGKSGMGGGVCSIETLLDYWRPLTVLRPL
jgi:acyl-CoA reductase-like NAD-dependent aldehyde dehydrogenase